MVEAQQSFYFAPLGIDKVCCNTDWSWVAIDNPYILTPLSTFQCCTHVMALGKPVVTLIGGWVTIDNPYILTPLSTFQCCTHAMALTKPVVTLIGGVGNY